MTNPQLELFNPKYICEFCGNTSPTKFTHNLNHHQVGNDPICFTERLIRNQLANALRTGNQDQLTKIIDRLHHLGIPL